MRRRKATSVAPLLRTLSDQFQHPRRHQAEPGNEGNPRQTDHQHDAVMKRIDPELADHRRKQRPEDQLQARERTRLRRFAKVPRSRRPKSLRPVASEVTKAAEIRTFTRPDHAPP